MKSIYNLFAYILGIFHIMKQVEALTTEALFELELKKGLPSRSSHWRIVYRSLDYHMSVTFAKRDRLIRDGQEKRAAMLTVYVREMHDLMSKLVAVSAEYQVRAAKYKEDMRSSGNYALSCGWQD
jgi:hypothetical protein